MLRSMTGFASATGTQRPHSWTWEVRSVNGKGLDLRVRVPDWIEGLETTLRQKLTKAAARGSVTFALRVWRDEDTVGTQKVNPAQLDAVLTALSAVEARAGAMGIALAPSRASDLLSLRGVLETATDAEDTSALSKTLCTQADALIDAFNRMRATEGEALEAVLQRQLDEIDALTSQAHSLAQARAQAQAETLMRNLARVLDNSDGADPDRVAQELAMLAVKSDVTEEIDRLRAHVGAARDLIGGGGAVGRKLDFLMQEFNRETNTLCSKAQATDLTQCGLALKSIIDQMREQVQNVE
ncbi:MAG: YicC/YloC family endoribonuclease [Roseobacter sp.]